MRPAQKAPENIEGIEKLDCMVALASMRPAQKAPENHETPFLYPRIKRLLQ